MLSAFRSGDRVAGNAQSVDTVHGQRTGGCGDSWMTQEGRANDLDVLMLLTGCRGGARGTSGRHCGRNARVKKHIPRLCCCAVIGCCKPRRGGVGKATARQIHASSTGNDGIGQCGKVARVRVYGWGMGCMEGDGVCGGAGITPRGHLHEGTAVSASTPPSS